ncbi:glycoside hydrolase family 65 protein [Streptomyces sp. NRRL S-87]|uniref:glycoside hydrolase family 65 protein n=1 Tax=Streptomyces sp. NRRL S-87 TaxID=1463920 RepID=UPI0004BF79E9|nr:glycosyl hydrolase family 65 protein [Streptomyces sp. NRRL S-87]
MIPHPSFATEPWQLRETELDLDVLAQSESVFALSNGHLGWRGNLDEGEPHGLPGSYLNGVHETHPLPYAEAGYGYPESGQTAINVTDGKVVRLLVDDHPFDLRYGRLHSHERVLDFRTGILSRTAQWTTPSGRTVRLTTQRLVSLAQRAVAAIAYTVEAVDGPATVAVQSELVANEQLPTASDDPRVAAVIDRPLRPEEHHAHGTRLRLVHCTGATGQRVAVAADHLLDGPEGTTYAAESEPDVARLTVTAELAPGQRLSLVKFVSHGWSAQRSLPALRDQVEGALAAARSTGWEGLCAAQRTCLDDFWADADVEVEGDDEVQQAVRFALFHLFQAAARAEERALPAKGLTGTGYDGHAFWDTESFVLPVLTHTAPHTVGPVLRWRHSTLPGALERARQLGLRGAAFPWRTISGAECSAYWPAGTVAFHVNADIAAAAERYVAATGDQEFHRGPGLDLLVHTARLWRSLGHFDSGGVFHIDGVTGPDEYSAVARDNLYTNVMARKNLLAAADAVARHPERAAELDAGPAEAEDWRRTAAAVAVPYSPRLQVHEQAAGFTDQEVWDFDGTAEEQYPLLLHFPYFDLYRKQVVKQADLVLAMLTCPEAFTPEEKGRNFAYYEPLTVRDSSLSACCQAVLAAETGHLGLAWAYTREAALMDLDDLEHNTRDGLHMASLAGTWIALVQGTGGLRLHYGLPTGPDTGSDSTAADAGASEADGGTGTPVHCAPRLPSALTRLAFTIRVRNRRLRLEIDRTSARYALLEGPPLQVAHHGETVWLTTDAVADLPVPPLAEAPAPRQPRGRAPRT